MKAVIFDRDGVIIDSEPCDIESAVKAFKKVGVTIEEKEKEWIIGRRPEDFSVPFLKKYDFSYDEFRKFQREEYHKLIDDAPFFEHAIKLIKDLHKHKIPIALTTSSSRGSTDKILKKAGLDGVFDIIVTYEDYGKRKPHPDPYIVTARKLGFDPKDCIAIEDTSLGVESATKAGMKCIAIPHKYTKHQDFSDADLVVDSAEKISIDLLNNL